MPIETITIRIEKNITFQKIIKKDPKKNMTDFLQIPNKSSNKKRREINKSKWKTSIGETSLKKGIISSLNSSDKKKLLIPILITKIWESKAQNIKIVMINMDTYCVTCHLKRTQVSIILMKDIQYQVEKENKAETNLKSIISQKYDNFFDVFSKKDSNTLLIYWKYDYKIYLKEEQNSGHILLYKISSKKLDAIKLYLNSPLAKKFIQARLTLFFLLILFMKKPKKKIQFCVDYRRLNTITKKDRYLIPLIEETLAQFMTFLIRFGVFKYLIMPFGLYNDLFLSNTLLIIYYLTFCIVLYKHTSMIFLLIIRC